MRKYDYSETEKFIEKELDLEADYNWIRSHSVLDQLRILLQFMDTPNLSLAPKKKLLQCFKKELMMLKEANKKDIFDHINNNKYLVEDTEGSLKKIADVLIQEAREEKLGKIIGESDQSDRL